MKRLMFLFLLLNCLHFAACGGGGGGGGDDTADAQGGASDPDRAPLNPLDEEDGIINTAQNPGPHVINEDGVVIEVSDPLTPLDSTSRFGQPIHCRAGSYKLTAPERDLLIDGGGREMCIRVERGCRTEITARSITLTNCRTGVQVEQGSTVILNAVAGGVQSSASRQALNAEDQSTVTVAAAAAISFLSTSVDKSIRVRAGSQVQFQSPAMCSVRGSRGSIDNDGSAVVALAQCGQIDTGSDVCDGNGMCTPRTDSATPGQPATGGADLTGNCQTAHTTGVPHSHGNGHGGCDPGQVTSGGGTPPQPTPPPQNPPATGGPATGGIDQGGVCQTAHTTGVPHSHGNGHGGCNPGQVTSGGGTPPQPTPPPQTTPATGGPATGGIDQGGVCQTSHTTGVPHSHGNGHGGCNSGVVVNSAGATPTPRPGATTGVDVTGVCQTGTLAHTTSVPHSHGNGHGGCVPGEVVDGGRTVVIQRSLDCSAQAVRLNLAGQDLIIRGNGVDSCIRADNACNADLTARSITLTGCGSCVEAADGSAVSLTAQQGGIVCDSQRAAVSAAAKAYVELNSADELSLLRTSADKSGALRARGGSVIQLNAAGACALEYGGGVPVELDATGQLYTQGCAAISLTTVP